MSDTHDVDQKENFSGKQRSSTWLDTVKKNKYIILVIALVIAALVYYFWLRKEAIDGTGLSTQKLTVTKMRGATMY